MEEWQRRYVTANMPQLIKLTICNETLLSRLSSNDILSHADLDYIQSTLQHLERTRRLYDILQTRVGGFGVLSRALAESKQSGAYEIFRYIECLPTTLHISFSLEAKPLTMYLDEEEIKEIIQKHVHVFKYKGQKSETVSLLKHAPPPQEPLYISRYIFRRNIVNIQLFQQKSSDIFVFKGVHDLHKLVEMVRPQIASKSSSQLEYLTSRFIQLEDDEDWKEICEIATAPVHLIKYEEETKTCVLEQTKGLSNIMKQHTIREQKSQNAEVAISEDTLIQHVVTDSGPGVCICDLPGMGKTLLLAKISKKLTEFYPERFVAFITLSQFINSVASNDIPRNCSKQVAQKLLVENLAVSLLAHDILDKMLSKGAIRMELLFDGFDEVPFQFISFTKKLLTEFTTKLSNTRIYVTSRPHLREEIENNLRVHSYDILPFSEANQLEFLVSFWKREIGVNDEKKLEQFAKFLLEKLRTNLSKSEQNMTGIPLQCRLLAEVYSRSAKLYASRTISIQECCHFEASLPHLYRKYVEQSFEKKLSSPLEKVFSSEVQKYHIFMAIKTIFPECEAQILQEFIGNMSNSVEDLSISIGILERRLCNGGAQSVEFVHRTFAEYFASYFIAQILNSSQIATPLSDKSKVALLKFLVKTALRTKELSGDNDIEEHVFVNFVVVYFLDFFLGFCSPLTSIQQLANLFPSCVPPIHLNAVLFGCARENYTKLIGFIHAVLLHMKKVTLVPYKKEMLQWGKPHRILHLLNVASLLSSHVFVDQLFTLFLECFECDLSVICNKLPLNVDTPLHIAIDRANVEMVQFFSTHVSLEGREILRSCVIGSNEYPLETVKTKIEICKILLGMNRNILDEAKYTLYHSAHVKLIKALIDAGADARAAESGENIVHHSAGYMSSDDFHELCRFLILDHNANDLFVANEPEWRSPLQHIFRRQEKISIETRRLIFGIDGVDVNEEDDHKNNLFFIAVEGNQDLELLDFLVNAGADIDAINDEGQCALHLAAEANNARILTFLLNLEMNCCLQDSEGNTFLHLLGNERVTAEEYQEIANVLAAKRHNEIFNKRNKDGQLPIHWAVHHLELTMETLQLLKSNLVDFNAVDNEGWSVLMCATRGGRSVQFLEMLIDLVTDVMIRNVDGETFVHLIAKFYTAEQYHELVVLLMSKGFEEAFTTKDVKERTPLHWAAFYIELLPKTLQLIHGKLIHEKKVDINYKCSIGCSILMHAAMGKRSLRILKTLTEMGADVYTKDLLGNSFASYIRYFYSLQEHKEIVEILKIKGQQENIVFPQQRDGRNGNGGIFRRTRNKISSSRSENSTGYCVLMSAAEEKRSVSVLKSMIEKGADIHMQNQKGDNFAHLIPSYYSAEQYHEMVEFLISRGLKKAFAVENNNGETPIHIAVSKLELLNSTMDLLNANFFQTSIVHVNSTDEWGDSILISAAKGKRSVSFLKSFIEKGADIHVRNQKGDNFAHIIPSYYSADQYHEIIEFIINRSQEKVFGVANNIGQTPIHVAVSKLELLESTLDLFDSTLFQTNIVGVNFTDEWGDSIFIFAAKGKRSVSFLNSLIEKGADIHFQNQNGDNFAHLIALFYSAEQYHRIIEFIISRGQQELFAVTNKEGLKPIHCAVFNLELHSTTLKLLLSCSVLQNHEVSQPSHQRQLEPNSHGLNEVDARGNSVLYWALMGKRSLQFVKHFISMGADWSVKNKHNTTSAHYSASLGLIEHLKYFVELGCDVNALDNHGDNVLQCVIHDASENVYEIITFLLEKGADQYHKNKEGHSAYSYAVLKKIADQRILDALK